MHADGSHAEAGVALVGDEHDAAGIGADEIAAGDAGLRLHVFLPQIDAGAAGDRFRIVVVIGGDALAQEGLGDFPAVLVDDRLDDVRRLVVVELDDELAEVGLQALDAVFDQKRVEVDFLGRHRLGFGELGDAVALEDGENRLARVFVGGGEVDVHAAGDERLLGLGEVVAEMVERVVLDGGGELADRIRIRVVLVKHLIALVGAGADPVMTDCCFSSEMFRA